MAVGERLQQLPEEALDQSLAEQALVRVQKDLQILVQVLEHQKETVLAVDYVEYPGVG